MAAKPTESFTLRLPKALHDRLIGICAATGSEVTRTGLIIDAVTLFVAMLDARPSMIEGYDPARDKSARQKKRGQGVKNGGRTDGNECDFQG